MNHACRKLAVLAFVAVVVLVLGGLGPAGHREVAEADLGMPGGIGALPSAAPAIPGVTNQGVPAIIRAREPGNVALVSVFCDPTGQAPTLLGDCAGELLSSNPNIPSNPYRPIVFELTRVYPPDGEPASTFAASGTAELTCMSALGPLSRGGPCDYSSNAGVVVVEVDGGGVNEIVRVTATDAAGESRSVDIVVVDTILAWGPTGVLSTAAQHEPAFISYACDDIGRHTLPEVHQDPPLPTIPLSLAAVADVEADPLQEGDGVAGLDDLWDLFYGDGSGLNLGSIDNNLFGDINIPLWWCGGDTDSTLDDFVDFETDLGILSMDPAGVDTGFGVADLEAVFGFTFPLTVDYDCGDGKNIDAMDVDAMTIWGSILEAGIRAEGGCDADFARNGVVTPMILGNGEVGVATIQAQQGGGVSPRRTINLTFVGEAALSLFIDAPETVGVEGDEFSVVVVDQDGRPVGNETVQCTVEPTGGALVVVPQTGTTGSVQSEDAGSLTMRLVPTGASVVAGEELTLTCVLDRDRSLSASTAISLGTTPGLETVDLPAGCFLVGSTWEDDTDITTVASAVTPVEALDTMWAFDPATGTWLGFSPEAPAAVSDLTSLDRLEPFFICMSEPGAVGRPVI